MKPLLAVPRPADRATAIKRAARLGAVLDYRDTPRSPGKHEDVLHFTWPSGKMNGNDRARFFGRHHTRNRLGGNVLAVTARRRQQHGTRTEHYRNSLQTGNEASGRSHDLITRPPTPQPRSASSSAIVPFATAMACRVPAAAAYAVSTRAAFLPRPVVHLARR